MKTRKKQEIEKTFPKTFLWGTATSATQIDGGDTASDWFEFCQKATAIKDKSSCFTACNHWNLFEKDFSLMKSYNLNAYRLGVDWSRFQPENGSFNNAAMDHFRGMLNSLRKKKIRPLLTLNHFAHPIWWAKKGGWTREENIEDFIKFIDFIVENTGDLVSEYITFNEPNVYWLLAYMGGIWPPANSGISGYINGMKVLRNMVIAHCRIYDRIKTIHSQKSFSNPVISIAQHIRVMDPKNPGNLLDVDRAQNADFRFNWMFPDAIQAGCLIKPLGNGEKIHDGQAWDFCGLNYYSRNMIEFDLFSPQSLFIKETTKTDSLKNDLGWEIYPEGLTRTILSAHKRYGLPIRITENGIAAVNDSQRQQYLVDHLGAVHTAKQQGAQVDGYYHWSFMDNFEWAEGYTAKFGLIEVDFETMARKPRESAKLYKKIIKSRRLP